MIAAQSREYASESTRWYTQEGVSVEDVAGKNGDARKVTLRDARKPENQYIPSVTTVMKLMAKPELDRWKVDQYMEAAWDTSSEVWKPSPGEYQEQSEGWKQSFLTSARTAAENRMSEAREKGTEVHGEVDRFLLNPSQFEYASSAFCGAATQALIDLGISQWPMEVEKTLAVKCGDIWIAGKTDLVFPEQKIIVDWKTTSKACDGSERLGWDEHLIQLSAYNLALFGGMAHCYNVFLSTSHPGKYQIIPWEFGETERGIEMYSLMFRLWCLKNRYFPNKLS